MRGAVVTFQTTQRGVEKLAAAGVQSGVRFALRLLADLTRTGDARTALSGRIKLSVPLSILSASALTTLETTGHLPEGTAAVAALRRWCAEDASAEWERLRRERNQCQQGFAFDVPGELKF